MSVGLLGLSVLVANAGQGVVLWSKILGSAVCHDSQYMSQFIASLEL